MFILEPSLLWLGLFLGLLWTHRSSAYCLLFLRTGYGLIDLLQTPLSWSTIDTFPDSIPSMATITTVEQLILLIYLLLSFSGILTILTTLTRTDKMMKWVCPNLYSFDLTSFISWHCLQLCQFECDPAVSWTKNVLTRAASLVHIVENQEGLSCARQSELMARLEELATLVHLLRSELARIEQLKKKKENDTSFEEGSKEDDDYFLKKNVDMNILINKMDQVASSVCRLAEITSNRLDQLQEMATAQVARQPAEQIPNTQEPEPASGAKQRLIKIDLST